MTEFKPADAREAQQAIAACASEAKSIRIIAGGSKQNYGRPITTTHTLNIAKLNGIIDYDPAELVISAKTATPLADITAALNDRGQILAFEPPDWRALLQSIGEPTIGGTIACDLAGPRRVRAGAARDHFLGFAAINGFAEPWKSGGRVVKNVTGYDMCKLQAGAFGTLSLLLEASLRVLPKPETSCTVLITGLPDETAITRLSEGLNTPHEVSAAAHLPKSAAHRAGFNDAVTLFRLEGHTPSVAYRAEALHALFDKTEFLPAPESTRLWTQIANVQPLLANTTTPIWRICTAPTHAPAMLQSIQSKIPTLAGFYDWGGGLLWLELDSESPQDCGAAVIRAALAPAGGHATLLRAPDDIRSTVPVFEPAPAPLQALTRRVKSSFDPQGIFNPGRMQQGL